MHNISTVKVYIFSYILLYRNINYTISERWKNIMSFADRLIHRYHDMAMRLGFRSDNEVIVAWSKNPVQFSELMNLRLQAIQAKKTELNII